jgi:phage baseplate assembly protein W
MADINETFLTDIQHDNDFVKEDDPDGDLTTISGLDNYKQALMRRWMTTPGSLLHRPNYGAGLKDLQGAPNTLQSKRDIARRIKEQALRDSRTEEVTSVTFENEDLEPEKLTIIVSVKPAGYEDVTIELQPFTG